MVVRYSKVHTQKWMHTQDFLCINMPTEPKGPKGVEYYGLIFRHIHRKSKKYEKNICALAWQNISRKCVKEFCKGEIYTGTYI